MKVFFVTFGCKVNQYDTQLLRESFARRGYTLAEKEEAELVLINTCCVTEKAEKDCFRLIRRLLQENRQVWLTGCLVRKDRESLRLLFPEVLIFDRDFLLKFDPARPAFCSELKTISYFSGHVRAFVKVQEGCENNCSYCIVPLVRGRCHSRPVSEILQEIEILRDNNYQEIILTGIDLGSYGKDNGTNFTSLLKAVFSKSSGIRIRLSSVELKHVDDGLLKLLRERENFCPHFHIPLQSGSDRILQLMGRGYTASQYLKTVEKIKEFFPGVTLSTDCLVGFPGERREDFQKSCNLVEKAGFIRVHVFPYSKRPGTLAVSFAHQVKALEIKERRNILTRLAFQVSQEEKKKFVGTSQELLVEKVKDGYACGHTANYLPVSLPGKRTRPGKLLRVRLSSLDRTGWLQAIPEYSRLSFSQHQLQSLSPGSDIS